MGRIPRALPRAARAAVARVLGVLRGARRTAAARARADPRVALPRPLSVSRRARLRALAAARAAMASPRLVRPVGRRALAAASGRGRAALRLARQPRVGGRRADEAARRGAGGDPAPLRRVERAAARPDRARAEHE